MIDILFIKAIILGLIEGATEFIPVSSTGHLIIAREWLAWNDQRADVFIIFIQLPAILAVVWLYRKKIWDVLRTLPSRWESRRLAYNLVLGTLPAVIVGLPTDRWVEENLYSVPSVAAALIVGGLLIFLIEAKHHRTTVHSVDDIPIRLAIGVGMIQVLAMLWPGLSRSGATIMGGLVLGLSRVAATEFSFFLAIPAMFGATAVKMWEFRTAMTPADLPIFAIGAVVSFLSALVAIKALISFVSQHTFRGFAWYRIAVGVLLLLIFWGPL